jgi:hypothetical protein
MHGIIFRCTTFSDSWLRIVGVLIKQMLYGSNNNYTMTSLINLLKWRTGIISKIRELGWRGGGRGVLPIPCENSTKIQIPLQCMTTLPTKKKDVIVFKKEGHALFNALSKGQENCTVHQRHRAVPLKPECFGDWFEWTYFCRTCIKDN